MSFGKNGRKRRDSIGGGGMRGDKGKGADRTKANKRREKERRIKRNSSKKKSSVDSDSSGSNGAIRQRSLSLRTRDRSGSDLSSSIDRSPVGGGSFSRKKNDFSSSSLATSPTRSAQKLKQRITRDRRKSLGSDFDTTTTTKSILRRNIADTDAPSIIKKVPGKQTEKKLREKVGRIPDKIDGDNIYTLSSSQPKGYKATFWQGGDSSAVFVDNMKDTSKSAIQELQSDFDLVKVKLDPLAEDINRVVKDYYIKGSTESETDTIIRNLNEQLAPDESRRYERIQGRNDDSIIRLQLREPKGKEEERVPSSEDDTDPREDESNIGAIKKQPWSRKRIAGDEAEKARFLEKAIKKKLPIQSNKDFNFVPTPSVDSFNESMGKNKLSKKSDEYKNLEKALSDYNERIKGVSNEIEIDNKKITDLGKIKAVRTKKDLDLKKQIDSIKNDNQIQSRLDSKKQNIENYNVEKEGLFGKLANLNNQRDQESRIKNESEQTKIEARIKELDRLTGIAEEQISDLEIKQAEVLIKKNKEINELREEIRTNDEQIKKIDIVLAKRIKDSKDKFITVSKALEVDAKQLIAQSNEYIRKKREQNPESGSDTLEKIRIAENLGVLAQQAADQEGAIQVLLDINSKVWNTDFNLQLAKPAKSLNSGTASDVFIVETNGNIGDSNTNIGYAKVATKRGDKENDATRNLGMPVDDDRRLTEEPGLIIRAVVASRVAELFKLNIVATEVLSKGLNGKTLGITAEVNNAKQIMKNVIEPDGTKVQEYTRITKKDLQNERTQKDASDTGVFDDILGQIDRHLGNVLRDEVTGRLITIDQDQNNPNPPNYEFDGASYSLRERRNGPEDAVRTTNNSLRGRFTVEDGKLKHLVGDISAELGAEIIKVTPDEFRKVLEKGESGDSEEVINKLAIDHTIERYTAVRDNVIDINSRGGLIKKWTIDTFNRAINSSFKKEGDTEVFDDNYLGRMNRELEIAADPSEKKTRLEPLPPVQAVVPPTEALEELF